MKPYPPVMREKRRYITFKIACASPLSKKDAVRALWGAALDALGYIGCADSAFWVIDFDEKTQEGIVRCGNTSVSRVLAALCLLGKASNKKARVHIISVTGTVKKAKNTLDD
ncbi:MAG: Rpp14/Pop5 family protein [archaeon]